MRATGVYRRQFRVFSVAVLLVLGFVGTHGQQPGNNQGDFVSGEVLVQFRPGVDENRRAAVRAQHGARVLRRLGGLHVERLRLPANADAPAVARALAAQPEVEAAQLNFIRHLVASAPPNDPYWISGSLWGLEKIAASQAWTNFGDGAATVVVGDFDTGVDYTHPDLAANMWKNPGEIPGNGVDDDQNGYVDDVYGINAITGSGNPMDDHGHGTHTSGTFGAVSNNAIGIAGVARNVRILGCKFISAQGTGYDSDALECFNYVLQLKQRGENIRVTSNSWGGPRTQVASVLKDAVDAAGNAGIINVFAAGNYAANNDTSPFDPASFTSPSIIAVAASDSNDARADFSNYGAVSVDLAAPGVGILSTVPGSYEIKSGTSMAAPHVAGAVALLLTHRPTLTVSEAKDVLLANVDALPQWNGLVASNGRLNLVGMLSGSVPNAVPTVSISSPADASSFTAPAQITVTATASDPDGTINRVDFYANGGLIGSAASTPYSVTWTGVPAGTYSLTAVATDDDGATTTSLPVQTIVGFGGGAGQIAQTLLTTQVPAVIGTGNFELGVRIVSDVAGTIQAIRFWKVSGEADTHIGRIWSAGGQQLAAVTFINESASGWQQQALAIPLAVAPDTEYLVSVNTTNGLLPATTNAFANGLLTGHLRAVSGDNGRYGGVGQYPAGSSSSTNYFRDLVFTPNAGDSVAPTITLTQPTQGATVSGTTVVAATASDNVGIAGVQFKVDGINLGAVVTTAPYQAAWGTTGFAAGTHTVTATARDAAGNATTDAVTVTIVNGTVPSQTLLTTQVPAVIGAGNFELGVRIVSDVAGTIQAIRFWKVAGEADTHIGRIWSASGQQLAAVTFIGESASGWQQQALAVPLAVAPETEYLVSVNTTNRLLPATTDAFANGLLTGHLRAVSGDNGRYGGVGQYPAGSASSTNYFRDLVFTPQN